MNSVATTRTSGSPQRGTMAVRNSHMKIGTVAASRTKYQSAQNGRSTKRNEVVRTSMCAPASPRNASEPALPKVLAKKPRLAVKKSYTRCGNSWTSRGFATLGRRSRTKPGDYPTP